MAKIDPKFILVRTYTNDQNKTFKRGQEVKMSELFGAEALWEMEGDDKKGSGIHIIKHWALEKIVELSGVRVINGQDGDGEWVQMGKIENAMTFIKKYVMEDLDGKRYQAIGEANPQNADTKVGLSYMADKRAYDRCAIRAMGLAGKVYSEDENDALKKSLDGLTEAEQKAIAPLRKKLYDAKSIEQVQAVQEEIELFLHGSDSSEIVKKVLNNSYAKRLEQVKAFKTTSTPPKPKQTAKPKETTPQIQDSNESIDDLVGVNDNGDVTEPKKRARKPVIRMTDTNE